jgi:hypothetical protein
VRHSDARLHLAIGARGGDGGVQKETSQIPSSTGFATSRAYEQLRDRADRTVLSMMRPIRSADGSLPSLACASSTPAEHQLAHILPWIGGLLVGNFAERRLVGLLCLSGFLPLLGGLLLLPFGLISFAVPSLCRCRDGKQGDQTDYQCDSQACLH